MTPPLPRPRPQRVKHRPNSVFFYASRAIAAMLVMGAMAAIGILIIVTMAQSTSETPAAAPPNSIPSPYAAYFVAPDSDGIQQVWGLMLPDGQSTALTHAPQSVFHFALSADHTQIVYMSDNQIWRQTLGQSDAESLVYVSGHPDFVTLALSPDGQWLAYRNHGLWILDLAAKNPQELLTDFPLEENALNVPGLRRYSPMYFLDNERLMVNIRMWETTSRGIYFLSSRTMQEVAGAYGMLEMMPLADGRYLAYSETRTGLGIDGFLVGQPAADPLEPFLLNPILNDVFAAHQLAGVAITDAIEVAPGQIRFIGTSFVQSDTSNPFPMFMGTYDFSTNALTIDSSPETLDLLAQAAWIHGLSPDGRYVVGYLDANWVETGLQYNLAIVDLETRTPVTLTAPGPARYFEWANAN